MKTTVQIIVTLIIAAAVSAFAAEPKIIPSPQVDWQKAELNYRAALNSENIGVRHSAALYIAEYQLSGTEQDLIRLLERDKVEKVRMTAAVALMKLGLPDGRKAVEEAVIYDGSEKVAKFCEQLIKSTSHDISER